MAGPAEVFEWVPLFASLGAEDHARLAAHSGERRLAAGETIYRAGDPIDAYFAVRAGTVHLIADPPEQGRELLGRLRPGDCFGECGFFEGGERMETAEAAEPAVVLRLERQALLDLLDERPLIALKLRLSAAREFSARVESNLAIAKRRAARFFVHQKVELTETNGGSRAATMVDLSELGVRIDGAPGTWGQNREVDLEMAWEGTSLRRAGRVAWYREGLAGVEFTEPTERERSEVRALLIRLLRRRGAISG